jgi:hypothetical protein
LRACFAAAFSLTPPDELERKGRCDKIRKPGKQEGRKKKTPGWEKRGIEVGKVFPHYGRPLHSLKFGWHDEHIALFMITRGYISSAWRA